jgi:DNA-binding SARP family transcriptional activator
MPANRRYAETLLRRSQLPGTRAGEEFRLSLLGSFELSCNDGPVPVPLPVQRLLAFLALRDHPARRDYVACMLWMDSSDDRALGSLRSALWRLRRSALGSVESTSRGLQLAPEVAVDVREASVLARRLLDPATDVEQAEVDRMSLASDLLPDWYDDWVVMERERFRQLRVHALEALCERLMATGDYALAVEAALAAVQGEPLRESAHRALIRVHLAEGNRAQAVFQYRSFRRLLDDQLGLQPTGEMEALVASLIRQ